MSEVAAGWEGVTSLTDGVVTLRRPVGEDARALAGLVRTSHVEISRFLTFAHDAFSEDEASNWIRGLGDEDHFVIIDSDAALVGACGLNRFSVEHRFANLGYWVATPAAGRGFGSRAVLLLARYGFEHRALERIEITMSVENIASKRVAEKAGATFEGTRRRLLRLHDRHHDAHTFSLIRDDPLPNPGP